LIDLCSGDAGAEVLDDARWVALAPSSRGHDSPVVELDSRIFALLIIFALGADVYDTVAG